MITPPPDDLDDPANVLRYLDVGLRALRDALDDGVSFADLVLSDLPSDPHFWAHCVRYHAANRLTAAAAADWRLTRLPNSGIVISRDPLTARLFKTQFGGPPHPGHSKRRRGFFVQPTLKLDWNGAIQPVGANLIVDWTTDNREIVMALSQPIAPWNYSAKPKLAWRRQLVFDDQHLRFNAADEDVSIDPNYEDLDTPVEPGQIG